MGKNIYKKKYYVKPGGDLKIFMSNATVGVEVQNSCVLGLGILRVQIDKY